MIFQFILTLLDAEGVLFTFMVETLAVLHG